MAAWRYEISLLELKIFHSFAALTREIFFNSRREISYLRAACIILYLFDGQESRSVGEWIGAVSTEVEWVKNLKSSNVAASDYEKKVRIL